MLENKIKLALTFLFALISVSLPITIFAYQYSYPFKSSSVSALLMDANNGQIVYSNNPDQRIQPASLAKVMTLFVIFDALKQGDVQLNDEVLISKKAAQKKGSTMYLREGEKVPIVELIKGIAIVSGNDSSVAIAEGVFGSEQNLVDKMNQKLLELDLQNSNFKTVDGWPEQEQYTTTNDMAMLTYAFLKEHPEAIQYHQLKEFTHANIVLHNRNGLILLDPSVDGLKTGHVEEAGYHLIATAERENKRYIAVIMGAKNIKDRENEAMQLLNFGFNDLMSVKLFNKDENLAHLSVLQGVKDKLGLRPSEDGTVTIPASLKDFISYELEIPEQHKAPIEIGQKLGQVIIFIQKEVLKRIPLVASEDILQVDTTEPVASVVVKLRFILFVIFIIFCVCGIVYLYLRWKENLLKNKEIRETEQIRQRLDKLFYSDNNE